MNASNQPSLRQPQVAVSSEPPPAKPAEISEIERSLGLDGRGRWVRWVVWLVVLAGIGVGGWLLYQRGNTPAPPPAFKTAAVVRQDVVSTISATGALQPLRTVDIGAEISGRLTAVEVIENDPVHKGQVLARIDTEQLEARLEQAEAQLQAASAGVREARANLGEARRTRARVGELGAKGVVSEQEVDSAKAGSARAAARVQSAQAQERLARAQVESVKTDLGKAVIVSPIDGVVLRRLVEPGSTVVASMQTPVLLRLAEDLSAMELQLDVDEADVGVVEPGQRATFTVDAYPDRTFEGEVTKVWLAPQEIGNVVTYRTILSVDNGEGLLRPGMTSTATIVTGLAEGVLTVPNAALRFTPKRRGMGGGGFGPMRSAPTIEQRERMKEMRELMKGSKVFVVEGGRPRPVPVEVGATDGQISEVRPTLERRPLAEGAEVIVGVEDIKKGSAQ